MTSFFSFDDLICSICLNIFTEPVTLLCGHNFCRECITTSLSSQQSCPHCRSDLSMAIPPLTTNHILKGFAERTKEILKDSGIDSQVNESLCPEHEEKLKLFCVTDKQLVCLICKDGEKHKGHTFKPVKEAEESLKGKFQAFLQTVSAEISAAEEKARKQKEELTKTKEKSEKLTSQITIQFQEMHEFLRKKEAEIKNELKLKENEEVEKMNKSAKEIETVLSSSKNVEEKVKSALEITNTEKFLRTCIEGDSLLKTKSSFQQRAQNLPVVNSSLFLYPYESHLQFFAWKEMLQVIKPKPEKLYLSSQSSDGIVSEDGRSLVPACQECKKHQHGSFALFDIAHKTVRPRRHCVPPLSAFSIDQFTSGQHYWEVDVGQNNSWQLGLQNNFMSRNGGSYTIFTNNITKNVTLTENIRKIGIYLNCSTKELSFYDADNMKLIKNITYYRISEPLAAYFSIEDKNEQFPLTVCCY